MASNQLRFVFGLLVLAGCGGSVSTKDPGGSMPPTPPASTVDPTTPPAPRRTGSIYMTSGDGSFSASADFPVTAPPASAPVMGPCVLTIRNGQPAQAAVASESAGDIVIELPSSGSPTRSTLSFDSKTKSYDSPRVEASGSGRVERANAPIHLHAAGAGIPAFDVDVLSAFDTGLIEPAEDAPLPAGGSDLLVRWSDGGNDTVFVTLNIGESLLACQLPAATGQAIIPDAMVQKMVANANLAACAGGCIRVGVSSTRVATKVAAGDYDILVSHSVTSSRSMRAN